VDGRAKPSRGMQHRLVRSCGGRGPSARAIYRPRRRGCPTRRRNSAGNPHPPGRPGLGGPDRRSGDRRAREGQPRGIVSGRTDRHRPPGPSRPHQGSHDRSSGPLPAVAVMGDSAGGMIAGLVGGGVLQGAGELRELLEATTPKDQQPWVDRKLAAAFSHAAPAKGERGCRGLGTQPEARWPGAAAGCAKPPGHGHRPTARCRRPARPQPHEHELHREHDLDRARHDQEREAVARRQDEQTLVCRRGMRDAERSFRRLKGYRQLPTFVAALVRHVEAVPPACDAGRVA
jgi:hypothetical protein